MPFNIAKYDDWVEPTIYWIGLGTFGLCFLYAVTFKWRPELWKRALGVLLCIAVITQVTIQMRHGTWTKPVTYTPTLERMNQQKKEGLRFYGSPGFGMESPAVTRHMENGALDRSMARFYGNYIGVRTNKEAYDQMLRVRTSNTAVVEAFDRSSSGYNPSDILDQILLVHSSFNTVTFEVTNHIDGFLSFTWPNDGRWNADVDGTKSTIYKTNGIENGVFLKTGKHTVQFWYQSNATLIGAIIGTVTLIILGILFSFFSVAGWQQFAIGGVLTVSFVGMFAGWYHSLYNGNNLETTYAWTSAQFPNSKNLAYGKPTKMSSIRSVQMPYFYYSGLGVDGDIKGRPFSTHRRKGRPWWQVDLGSAKSIGEIVIYDRGRGRGNLPMNVTTSTDGRQFRTVMTIEDRGRTPVWRIQLNGESARFVRLHSMGRRPMSFYEIEIYPYTPNSKPAHPDPTGDLTLGSTE